MEFHYLAKYDASTNATQTYINKITKNMENQNMYAKYSERIKMIIDPNGWNYDQNRMKLITFFQTTKIEWQMNKSELN